MLKMINWSLVVVLRERRRGETEAGAQEEAGTSRLQQLVKKASSKIPFPNCGSWGHAQAHGGSPKPTTV